MIKNTSYFNIWDTVVKSNSTIYEHEIDSLKKEGLQLRTMTYFPHKDIGTYIFSDNKGFFTLIRREMKKDANDQSPPRPKYSLFVRNYSGFNDIKLVKQQSYLTLFTSSDKIGFIRTFDGKMSNAYCSVNGSDIVSIDFDQNMKGRFYVANQNGQINILHAASSK